MVDLSEFFSIQAGLLRQVPREHSRYLKQKIDWNTRLLGIVGGRGTGKTTLFLQYLAEQDAGAQAQLYISADHIRVQAMGIYEISASFFRLGGKGIVIDEVHKYTDWAQEIKNLYDSFPDSRIFFPAVPPLHCRLVKRTFQEGRSFTPFQAFPSGNTCTWHMDWCGAPSLSQVFLKIILPWHLKS